MKVFRKRCGCTYLLLDGTDGTSGELIMVWGCGPGFREPEVVRGVDLILFTIQAASRKLDCGVADGRKVGEFFRDLEIGPMNEFTEKEIGGVYGD